MPGQLIAVRAKGVGLDDLRAGIDIFAVDLGDQGRVHQVELIETADQSRPRAGEGCVPIAPSERIGLPGVEQERIKLNLIHC